MVRRNLRHATLPGDDLAGNVWRAAGAPYQCTLYQSFRFVPTQVAQDIMKRKRSRMLAANDPAESQAEALLQAADQLGSADWVMAITRSRCWRSPRRRGR